MTSTLFERIDFANMVRRFAAIATRPDNQFRPDNRATRRQQPHTHGKRLAGGRTPHLVSATKQPRHARIADSRRRNVVAAASRKANR